MSTEGEGDDFGNTDWGTSTSEDRVSAKGWGHAFINSLTMGAVLREQGGEDDWPAGGWEPGKCRTGRKKGSPRLS